MKIFKLLQQYKRNEDGATAVEFALVSVAFFMVLFGIIQASHMLWVYNAIRNATEVVSRQALTQEDMSVSELEDLGKETLQGYRVSPTSFSLEQDTVTQGGVEFNELTSTYSYSPFVTAFLPESLEDITFTVVVSRPYNWTDD